MTVGKFGWSLPPGAANDPAAPYNQRPEDWMPDELRRIADVIADEVYINAVGTDSVAFAVDADLDEADVRELIWRCLGGADVDFELEHRGAYDDHNDRWRVTLADGE